MKGWKAYANGETIDTKGTENGIILNNEEFSNEARITLEKGGYTPFGITCGIYGLMFHTAFANEHDEAIKKYTEMKEAVAEFINDHDAQISITLSQSRAVIEKLCRTIFGGCRQSRESI